MVIFKILFLISDSYPLISAVEPWVHASRHSTIILTCQICAENPYKVIPELAFPFAAACQALPKLTKMYLEAMSQ